MYGFGVVLIEILTGQRALDTNRPSGQHNLTEWIKPYLSDKRKLKNVMDSHLEGRYPSKAAYRIAQLALKCIEAEPKNRPSMKEVLDTLELLAASNERPPLEPRARSKHSSAHRKNHHPSPYRSPLHQSNDGYRGYSPRRR